MQYTFVLKNTKTNDVVKHKEDYDWDNEALMLFQWLENNNSCDCNRSLLMYDDETKELECNTGSNVIVIEKIIREDGSKVSFK